MSDCEQLTNARDDTKQRHKRKRKSKMSSKDDFGGMFICMGKKIDVREIIIIWFIYVMLHSEIFATMFLKKIKNAVNEDNTMTMKGTFISSILMVCVVVLCSILF
jgi:hypothetical protein